MHISECCSINTFNIVNNLKFSYQLPFLIINICIKIRCPATTDAESSNSKMNVEPVAEKSSRMSKLSNTDSRIQSMSRLTSYLLSKVGKSQSILKFNN